MSPRKTTHPRAYEKYKLYLILKLEKQRGHNIECIGNSEQMWEELEMGKYDQNMLYEILNELIKL